MSFGRFVHSMLAMSSKTDEELLEELRKLHESDEPETPMDQHHVLVLLSTLQERGLAREVDKILGVDTSDVDEHIPMGALDFLMAEPEEPNPYAGTYSEE